MEHIRPAGETNRALLMAGKQRHLLPDATGLIVIDILQPFHCAIDAMRAMKYPTLTAVQPLLLKLLEKTLKVTDSVNIHSHAQPETSKKNIKATCRSVTKL